MTAKPARFFPDPASWRAWLEKNHERMDELWVGFYKKGTGRASITWPESVDGALCFGWIDGVRQSIDEESYRIRFTPRRTKSVWSDVNVRRFAELSEAGLVAPAGLQAFEARTEARTGIYAYEQRRTAKLTAEEEKAFRANRKGWAYFASAPPYYRRLCLHWVVSAKRADTRKRRLETLIADSAAGRRIGPLRRPGSDS